MPFNGSGTFTIVNTFVPNTTILSAAVNQNFSDIATGLSDCLTRDGQAGMSAAFLAIAGTIGAPGITFSSDTTAGLYLSATGILGVTVNSNGFLLNGTVLAVATATVSAGGSGYAVGDTIILTGGTAVSQAILTVATLTGTAVATATVSYQGCYVVAPTNPAAQGSTSGSGTGATFTLTTATSSIVTNQANAPAWRRWGASTFISGLMNIVNGRDFVTALGASNVITAIGLSAPPPSSYKNLVIKVTTNTALTAAADFVVTTNGTAYLTTALSSTINMATTGANALDTGSIASATWYSIWAIAKQDGTTAGLASLQATSPTMPSGYTYKARIGWVRTAAGSAQLLGSWQFGPRAQYVLNLGQTGGTYPLIVTPSGTFWTAASVANVVPPTASEITGTSSYTVNPATTTKFGINANANPTLPSDASFYQTTYNPATTTIPSLAFSILLESGSIYYGQINTGTPAGINCTGWVDNI